MCLRCARASPIQPRWSSSTKRSCLQAAADPERTYIEVILPRKLRRQAEYVERANWKSDLAVIGRTLRLLVQR